MARPKKKPGDVRENVLRIRLTDEERKSLDDAAEEKSLDTSAWARSELLSLARKLNREKSTQSQVDSKSPFHSALEDDINPEEGFLQGDKPPGESP